MTQQALFVAHATCPECRAVFLQKSHHHVRCSGACRQQAWRDSKTPRRLCPGCGVSVTGRATYCGGTCQKRVRRWQQNGKPLSCGNSDCPRASVKMVHRFDVEAGAWVCGGCGQFQWW